MPHSALREGGSDDSNFQSEESVDSHAAGVCRSESGTFEMLLKKTGDREQSSQHLSTLI